jgi:hypothetical protein
MLAEVTEQAEVGERVLAGKCQCDAVRYRVEDAFVYASNCHCSNCRGATGSVVRDGEYVHVAMGSLVDAPSLRPTKHIFVGSKAAWFEITDDLPQFDEHATQPSAEDAPRKLSQSEDS